MVPQFIMINLCISTYLDYKSRINLLSRIFCGRMNDVSYDYAVLSNNNTVDPSLAAKGINM